MMRHSQQKRAPSGFTLIEIAVSIALGAIVLSAAVAVLAHAVQDQRRVQALAEMSRDGNFVGQLLSRELRQAGLGVRVPAPSAGTGAAAEHTNAAYGTGAPSTFYGGLLVGATDQVGILADLPRPDGQYPAYGLLHSRPTGSLLVPDAVMWHNENNGNCAPDLLAGSCSTSSTSIFFAGDAGCDNVTDDDRLCPWGAGRVRPNERVQIFAGNGSWVHSAAAASTGAVANLPLSVIAMPLQTSLDATAWANVLPGDSPGGNVGPGWLTTLDRVFFRRDAATRTILRRQCSGDPDPENPDFPNATGAAVPAAPALTPAGTGTLAPVQNICTPEEIVARNVDTFTLTYFNGANAAVAVPLNTAALKQSIRRIDYTITFGTTINTRPLRHSVAGSVRIQNQ